MLHGWRDRDGKEEGGAMPTNAWSAFPQRKQKTMKVIGHLMVGVGEASHYQLKPNAGSEKVWGLGSPTTGPMVNWNLDGWR